LKQRLDFPVEGNIRSMDSMAIIEEQKIVKTTVTLSISKQKQTMVTLAIIREQIFLETTVRFSISRKDENYG